MPPDSIIAQVVERERNTHCICSATVIEFSGCLYFTGKLKIQNWIFSFACSAVQLYQLYSDSVKMSHMTKLLRPQFRK